MTIYLSANSQSRARNQAEGFEEMKYKEGSSK